MRFQKKSMEELQRAEVGSMGEQQKHPMTIVLEDVRSLYNVGSVFRSCDAFGARELLLCGICGRPPQRDIQKTALGATETVHWKYFEKIGEAMSYLKEKGYFIYGIEQVQGSLSMEKLQFEAGKPVAFVLGNEVDGLSEACLSECDACIEIPQFGSKHSLNVSVTAGLVMWHWLANGGMKKDAQ